MTNDPMTSEKLAVNLRTYILKAMMDRNSKQVTYPSQLGIFLGLTGAGLVVSVILGAIIWVMMAGSAIPSKAEEMLQPKYYNVNMVLQGVSTFFLFFMPAYLFAKICYKRPNDFLGFNKQLNIKQVLLVVGILMLTFPLSGALGELNKILPIPASWAIKFKAMEASREAQEAALININTLPKYIMSLFMIAVLPAIFEETFFRAGMQNLFVRWFKSPVTAIIVTGIIFSLIHLSFYGFFVRFGLGVILGLLFFYSGNIWLPILFHLLFNGVQVTMLYILNRQNNPKAIKDIETAFPLWAGAIALLVIVYLFKRFRDISSLQKASFVEEEEAPVDDFEAWVSDKQ
ncbi:MAG: CPBP family intramembrane glutamic endopeptidase [Ginsengibacter sp.]